MPARAQNAGVVTDCSRFDAAGGLQAALASGKSVHFACNGTFIVPEILISTDTSLDATGQTVTLSGNNANRIFCVNSGGTLTLNHVSIQAGLGASGVCDEADTTGGAIYNAGTLNIRDSMISSSSASVGGGIDNAGQATLTNSSVTSNKSAASGGGISSIDGSLTVTGSDISDNTAQVGGGIFLAGGKMSIANSTISGNSATSAGGIWISAPATISGTTISDNTSTLSSGGGLITAAATTLINCTLSGNTAAAGGGGGILDNQGPLTITNSTIYGNAAMAYGTGGGIFSSGSAAAPLTGNGSNAALVLTNTIVAGNKAFLGPDIFGQVASKGHNLIANPSDASGFVDSDLLNADPQLGDTTGKPSYFPLLPGSPAINAADPTGCPPTDEAGNKRLQDGHCDIGAVEHNR